MNKRTHYEIHKRLLHYITRESTNPEDNTLTLHKILYALHTVTRAFWKEGDATCIDLYGADTIRSQLLTSVRAEQAQGWHHFTTLCMTGKVMGSSITHTIGHIKGVHYIHTKILRLKSQLISRSK